MKQMNKEIKALVKNTQKQIKRETELGNKFRETVGCLEKDNRYKCC